MGAGLTRDRVLRNFFGFIVHSCPERGWKILDDFLTLSMSGGRGGGSPGGVADWQ